MADNNINGMKAQDWKLLDTSRVDAAADQQTKLTVEQRQLVSAIAAVVKTAAEDIHGTATDDRYRYIVDLIVKRIKATVGGNEEVVDKLEELLDNVASAASIDNVEDTLVSIAKQLKDVDTKSIKQYIDSAIADIKFDSKFADSVASKVIDKLDQTSNTSTSSIKQFFGSTSSSAKTTKQKQKVKKSLQQTDILNKALQNNAAKSNARIVSRLAQIGNGSSSVIAVMQDKTEAAKNIDSIAAKINEISAVSKDKADDDSAESQHKDKKKQGILMRMLKGAILSPTMKILTAVGSTLAKLSKKVFGFIGKGIFALMLTPPGMYALGVLVGYVWAKWLKPFWNGKVLPFIKWIKNFFAGVGKVISWLKSFFGIDDQPDHAGSIYSAIKSCVKSAIAGTSIAAKVASATTNAVKKGMSATGKAIGKMFRGNAAKAAAKAAKSAKAAKDAGNAAKALKKAQQARKAAQELKHASELAKGTKKYEVLMKQYKQANAAAARAAKYAKEAEASSKVIAKSGKIAKAAKSTAKFIAKSVGFTTGATPAIKVAGKTLKVVGKTAKFGMKVLPGLGVAATAAFNKMEYDALKEQAKKLCDEYKVSSLEELMEKYGLKDKDGNDITDEVHFAAQNLINAVSNKLRTSTTDLALEGLDFILPGAGTALQIATNKAVKGMQEADKQRRAGMMQANKTTKMLVKSMQDQTALSIEIKNKINGLQNSDEKQAALKERLQKLQKTKALYKSIEAQEKEAENKLKSLNTGMFSFASSAENIKFWQDKADSLKQQKMALLKEQGFSTADMRDKAARWDKDKMTEEQRIAKQIIEAEMQRTNDISEKTYSMYAKAFGIKDDYSRGKSKIAAKFMQDISVSAQQSKQFEDIDSSLQTRAAEQKQSIDALSESNEKIADAVQQSSKDQKEASQQIIEKLDTLLSQHVYQQPSSTTNNVTVVSAPAQQNLAAIENGVPIRIM